ncbi:hypothetical protein DENSPDRAFT_842585 [Dentipellis sp. KUC8613]|nr:hypothetical protein DENSPDRAFT_842585 [Dentipellis sp. KUC8613]
MSKSMRHSFTSIHEAPWSLLVEEVLTYADKAPSHRDPPPHKDRVLAVLVSLLPALLPEVVVASEVRQDACAPW